MLNCSDIENNTWTQAEIWNLTSSVQFDLPQVVWLQVADQFELYISKCPCIILFFS